MNDDFERFRGRLNNATKDVAEMITKLNEHSRNLEFECNADGRNWDDALFTCDMQEALCKLGIVLAGLVDWQNTPDEVFEPQRSEIEQP